MSTRVSAISSMATRQFLEDVVASWRQETGQEVSLESIGGVDALRRVSDGESFDVVVLAADAIAKLTAAGRVVPGTEVALVRSGVAVAVRQGAPRPAIDTEDALREAVLSARSVGYSTGPSGVAIQKLFDRWGVTQTIRDRLVQAPPGVPVGSLLARGEVGLAFQQLSELMHLEGIEVIGPMPKGTEVVTVFTGAVCASSTQPDAARRWLDYVSSPAADEARRRHGMERASSHSSIKGLQT